MLLVFTTLFTFFALSVFLIFLIVRMQIFFFRKYRMGLVLFQMSMLHFVLTFFLLIGVWTYTLKQYDQYIAAVVIVFAILTFGSIWIINTISAVLVYAFLRNKRRPSDQVAIKDG